MAFSLAFAALFAFTAWHKGGALEVFRSEIALHGLAPETLIALLPRAVVGAEWVLAVLLCAGVFSRRVRDLATGLLAAFLVTATVYLAVVAVTRGTHLECGCLGGVESSVGTALLRNLGLLVMAGGLVAMQGTPSARRCQAANDGVPGEHQPSTGSFL